MSNHVFVGMCVRVFALGMARRAEDIIFNGVNMCEFGEDAVMWNVVM